MESRHREILLRMRDEDQLPQKLITMVERAELSLRRIGVTNLDARDLVILSAVVPSVKEPEEPRYPHVKVAFGAADTTAKTSKKKRKTTSKR